MKLSRGLILSSDYMRLGGGEDNGWIERMVLVDGYREWGRMELNDFLVV